MMDKAYESDQSRAQLTEPSLGPVSSPQSHRPDPLAYEHDLDK
jgi:hypothetical protein